MLLGARLESTTGRKRNNSKLDCREKGMAITTMYITNRVPKKQEK